MTRQNAVIVGSGPNGLAAAITLGRAGWDVTVLEACPTPGGGMRSAALTLPGYVHDVCSSIHPLGVASPFFRSLALEDSGLTWIHAPVPLAHPLDDGSAVVLHRSIDETAAGLADDGGAWRDLFGPLTAHGDSLLDALLAPPIPPRHPFLMARFGLHGVRSARDLARTSFRRREARALLAGLAAHAVIPLEAPGSASFALVLGMLGHTRGWPFPKGGSQAIADALGRRLTANGGRIVTGRRVESSEDVAGADAVLFDITPRQLVTIAGERLPASYRRRLEKFRYGPAAYKIDWALRGPIPWRAAACGRAATIHVGGTLEEIAASEHDAYHGRVNDRPFVLLTQPSRFDDTRAPAGGQTAWAYCHVPHGSTEDMTERIERQVERFAPGFREMILARHVMTPMDLEAYNANYVGGDIVGGSNDLRQLLARPVLSLNPYATPIPGWYLCSASTPPGGGVHGMCGFHAAEAALRALGGPRR